MKNKTLLLGGLSFSAMAALGLIACGDSSSSSGNPLEFNKDDLPACATNTDGSLLIVEGKLQQCMGKDTTWQEILCDKGKKLAASMQLADGEEYYNILCGSDTVGVLLNEVAESCKLEGKGTYKITCDGDSLGVITIKDAPKPVEESSSSVAEDEDEDDDNEDDVTEESSSSSSKKNSSSSAKEDEDESSSSKDKSSSSAKSSDSKEEGSSSSEKSSEETSSSSVNGSSSSVTPASSSSEECKDTETQTCLNGELIDNSKVKSCGTEKYNIDIQACTFENKIISKGNAAVCFLYHPVDGRIPRVYNNKTHACIDETIVALDNVDDCNGTQYNTTTHQCINGEIVSNSNISSSSSAVTYEISAASTTIYNGVTFKISVPGLTNCSYEVTDETYLSGDNVDDTGYDDNCPASFVNSYNKEEGSISVTFSVTRAQEIDSESYLPSSRLPVPLTFTLCGTKNCRPIEFKFLDQVASWKGSKATISAKNMETFSLIIQNLGFEYDSNRRWWKMIENPGKNQQEYTIKLEKMYPDNHIDISVSYK